MGKRKKVIFLTIVSGVLGLCLLMTGVAAAVEVDLSLNRAFFSHGEGYWGKVNLGFDQTQGFYLNGLQIDEYFQQLGGGMEYHFLDTSRYQVQVRLGLEKYNLAGQENSLLSSGIRFELPFADGELELTADLMMDELVGNFWRYQVEMHTPEGWMQGNFGFGNLLGSRDGYAIWFGFYL